MPSVSILMSIHNGLPYLKETVESVLAQTLVDFEFLIVDDASTDGTLAFLESLDDPRIRIIKHPTKQGLAKGLNEMAREAGGRFIARMDADDISEPTRLEKQVAFLESHPDVGVLGTAAVMIDKDGKRLRDYPVLTEHLTIKWRALFANPLAHPSVMLRREILLANPYDESYPNSQDYELWSRLLFDKGIRFANLDEKLLRYRIHHSSTTSSKQKNAELSTATALKNIRRYFNLNPAQEAFLRKSRAGKRLTLGESLAFSRLFRGIREAFLKKETVDNLSLRMINAEIRRMDYSLVKKYLRGLI